jgi:hypothetical protein
LEQETLAKQTGRRICGAASVGGLTVYLQHAVTLAAGCVSCPRKKPSPISHTGDGFCYLSGRLIAAQRDPGGLLKLGRRTNFSFIAPTPDCAALMIMESAESPWTYFQIRVLSVDRNARVPPSIVFESEYC